MRFVQLDLIEKRLQLLKEILGNPTRVRLTTTLGDRYWEDVRKQFSTLADQL